MSIYPEILAGFEAVKELASKRITVKDPSKPTHIPSDPIGLMNSFPAAYSLELIPLQHGVNVSSVGRFGFAGHEVRLVPYPVPHTEDGFAAALREALIPVINEEIIRVNSLSAADHKESPNGPFESADAIQEIR